MIVRKENLFADAVARWKRNVLIFYLFVFAGCSGLALVDVWRPVDIPLDYPYVNLNAEGAELFIYEVEIGQQSEWVFGPGVIMPTPLSGKEEFKGPLTMSVGIHVRQSQKTVDLRDVRIIVEDGRQTLPPRLIEQQIPDKRAPVFWPYEPTDGLVLVTSHSRIRLTYPIDVRDLKPFSLHLNLKVDGRSVPFPPIRFERNTVRRQR